MHGSRKSLAGWLQAASLFSFWQNGISSLELQRQLHLSSYQTAWSILHKLRKAAGLAEKSPLHGTVFLTMSTLPPSSPEQQAIRILSAVEYDLETIQPKRIKIAVQDSPQKKIQRSQLQKMVSPGATLVQLPGADNIETDAEEIYVKSTIPFTTKNDGFPISEMAAFWLNRVYRGAISGKYLNNYLDEFCFRYNTRTWSDKLAVLDHFVTGLISPKTVEKRAGKSSAEGGEYEK